MIKCQVCKTDNTAESIFCTRCGAKLTGDVPALLDEMKLYKDDPKRATALELDKRIDKLNSMITSSPPSFQTYPGLTIVTLLLMIFGWLLMFGGLFGFGSVYVSSLNVGIYYQPTPPSLEGGRPATSQPLNDATRTTTEIISGSLFVLGFLMVVAAEVLKLFIDLQENADRQSIALHGIYHLLLEDRKKDE